MIPEPNPLPGASMVVRVYGESRAKPAWRRILGYAGVALVAIAAISLLADIVVRLGARSVSPRVLGTAAGWLDRILIVAVFGWLGSRAGRVRWWEGAAAGVFGVLAVHLGAPFGRFVIAVLRSDERLEMARLVGSMLAARLLPLIGPGLLLLCLAGTAAAIAASRIRPRPAADPPAPLWETIGIAAAALTVLAFIGGATLILLGASGPRIPGVAVPAEAVVQETSEPPARPATVRLREAMGALQTHQELYFANGGYVYADDPALLDFEYPNAIVDIVFADENGWAATVTDAGNGDRCAIVVRRVPDAVRVQVVGRAGAVDVPVCSIRAERERIRW